MNARSMFEKLGYELVPRFVHIDGSVLAYSNYKKCITIEFYLKKKHFVK